MRALALRVAPACELWNIAPSGQTDSHRVIRPSSSIVVLEPLPQGMGRDAHDGVQLGIKIVRATEGLNRNVVLLDFGGCSFEVLFADKGQKAHQVIGPSEHIGRQYRL